MNVSRPTLRLSWTVAALSALVAPVRPALAQDRDLVGRLPQSASAVLVVHDAATIAQEFARSPAAVFLQPTALFQQTLGAWKGLAERLEWSQAESADRLLGGTCILVLADPPSAQNWALLTTISGESERRLRERLELAPSDIVAGQPVLALKDAELLLAVKRDEGLKPGRARLLLLGPAPRDGKGMFHLMLPVLAGDAPAPLRAAPVFEHVADAQSGMAFYSRVTGGGGGAAWSEFSCILVAMQELRVSADVVVRRANADAFAGLPRLGTTALEAFAGDAGLALVASLPAGMSAEWNLPWRSDAANAQADAGAERWAIRIGPGPARQGALAARLVGGAADSVADRLITMLEGAPAGTGAPPASSLEGLDPSVVRRAQLIPRANSWVSRIFGAAPGVAWHARPGERDGEQWWSGVIGAGGPAGAAVLEAFDQRTAALVADAGDAKSRRWIAWGRLDPSLLLDASPGPWLPGSPTRRLLDRMRRVSLGFWADDDGLVRGSVTLDLAPPADAPHSAP